MTQRLAGAFALLTLAAACGAPSVEDVQNAMGDAIETIGTEGSAAITSTSGMTSDWSAAAGRVHPILDPVQQLRDRNLSFDPLAPMRLVAPKVEQQTTTGTSSGDSFKQQMTALAKHLRERIFIEENVEERNGDVVIFRITGEDVCGDGVAAPDPNCVSAFDAYEVRLSARRLDGGIDVTLLLGPERHAPYRFQVTNDFMSLETNLQQLRLAYLYIAETSSQEPYGLPAVMEGVVEMRIVRHAEHDYSLLANVHQAVRIETDVQWGGGLYTYSVGASAPAASVRYDSVAERMIVDVDVAAIDYGFPYSPNVSTAGTAGDRMLLHIDGASFSFDVTRGAEEILITQIGLGDGQTYVSLDGTQLYALDLNAANGRHFDLRITKPTATSDSVASFSPELNLVQKYYLAPLKVDSDTYVSPWQEDETYTLALQGTSPSVTKVGYTTPEGFYASATKVVTGTMTISSSNSSVTPIVVNAGQCLYQDPPPEGSHTLLGGYRADTCP